MGGRRHERKEQPGLEMRKEVRPFQETGRRAAQRLPSGVGWWCMGGPRVQGLEGSTEVLGESREQPGKQSSWGSRVAKEGCTGLPVASF